METSIQMYQGTHSWTKSGSTTLHSEPKSLPLKMSQSFNKNWLATRIQMQIEINTLSKFFSINCKLSKKLALTFSHSGRDFYL